MKNNTMDLRVHLVVYGGNSYDKHSLQFVNPVLALGVSR
jgi:hypothetical protein